MDVLDHGFSRSNFEIAVFQEWEGWLTEQMGCESVIHDYDCDFLVTKVRCKDLLESDRGDFRCQHPLKGTQSFSFYSWCSKSKTVNLVWPCYYTFLKYMYLESSTSFCICSRMFTPSHNCLDHLALTGLRQCLTRVLFIHVYVSGNIKRLGMLWLHWFN